MQTKTLLPSLPQRGKALSAGAALSASRDFELSLRNRDWLRETVDEPEIGELEV